ncbi:hypothetical protein BJ508DRAFT_336287 [Ascobolus immersus RN42]|uniref:Uncharacterized protein n=1 Tax=Ascobolus immersus RN42 TaxID=1160509 RepID=A0A3N4HD58_ASCIM|nr:hypothetical protein BJ508DRAFT_336287 [Ascobolus immersus RN42]
MNVEGSACFRRSKRQRSHSTPPPRQSPLPEPIHHRSSPPHLSLPASPQSSHPESTTRRPDTTPPSLRSSPVSSRDAEEYWGLVLTSLAAPNARNLVSSKMLKKIEVAVGALQESIDSGDLHQQPRPGSGIGGPQDILDRLSSRNRLSEDEVEYLQRLGENYSYGERTSPGGEDDDGTASSPAANSSPAPMISTLGNPAYMPLADMPPAFRRTATCIRIAGLAEGPYSVPPGFRQIVEAMGNHRIEVVTDNEQHDTRSVALFVSLLSMTAASLDDVYPVSHHEFAAILERIVGGQPLALADREVSLGVTTLFESALNCQALYAQPDREVAQKAPVAVPHQASSPSLPPASPVPEAAQEAPEAVSTSSSRSATPPPLPALPQQPRTPLPQVTPALVTPAPGSAAPATRRRYRLRSVLCDAGIERSEVRMFYGLPRGQIEIGTPERDLWEDEE